MSVQIAIGSSVFQKAIEGVERLPVDDQLLLVDIVKRRLIQHRRTELKTVIAEAREAYRTGNVRRGTPEDLLKELEELDE
ncbi:MAG: hypothetical protein FJ011_21360 [Chloroflexi bacterium]|nr:hypothetical protein [Chloroflexota bacterium]